MRAQTSIRIRVHSRRISRVRPRAFLLACTLALPACGKYGQQLLDMQNLVVAVQAKYNQPVKVSLATTGALTLTITQPATMDTVKFTRADCADYAQDIARFAMHHYAQAATLSDISVNVITERDYGIAHMTESYCTGGGAPASLSAESADGR